MRWSYKTVHFALKKEGLLGSAFLDESEVELSLNEYGRAGWELVTILETMDGIIAVFKQPLFSDSSPLFQIDSEKDNDFTEENGEEAIVEKRTEVPVLDEFEVVEVDPEEEEREDRESSYSEKDVGAIRIE
ncbi:MAG: DUF4177 domain-containing protein [Deltaproteobacteria bacterium]|nr:DUF4177 domain-containing protein [Deltaproteobacteria bacterium]